jgi:GR25 family glycosyltransferase involved in LPS biosynthesis
VFASALSCGYVNNPELARTALACIAHQFEQGEPCSDLMRLLFVHDLNSKALRKNFECCAVQGPDDAEVVVERGNVDVTAPFSNSDRAGVGEPQW